MRLPLWAIVLSVLFSLVFISSGATQQYEYKDYVVKPGDTLWDITKSELEDAFQWPLVWKENLRINDPDLIYPGQVITIPVRVIPQEVTKLEPSIEITKPVPTTAPPAPEIAKPSPPVSKAPAKVRVKRIEEIMSREGILESGYITKNVPYEGEITGSATGRKLFGIGDVVYVDTRVPAEAGSKFYILRQGDMVRHPLKWKRLGYLVSVVGTIELEESGVENLKAKVLESFDSMKVGDILDYYYEVYPPFVIGEPRRPLVDAVVVTAKYLRLISGTFDIVFIDKGEDDGLRAGDVLMTLYPDTDDMRNSVIQLVNPRKKTSLGVVISSEKEVRRGDIVAGMR